MKFYYLGILWSHCPQVSTTLRKSTYLLNFTVLNSLHGKNMGHHSPDKAPYLLRIMNSHHSQPFLNYFLCSSLLHKLPEKELISQRNGGQVGSLQMFGGITQCPEGSGDSVILLQQTGLNFERLWHCSLSKLVI